jgi:hypothetical protein
MNIRFRTTVRHGAVAVTGLAIASALLAPVAAADIAPPHFDSDCWLTVVSQPVWVDAHLRTFVFSVTFGMPYC